MVRKIICNGKGSIICDERRGIRHDANAYETLSDILNPTFYGRIAKKCAEEWFSNDRAVAFIDGINEELALQYCVKFYCRFDENGDKLYEINFSFKLLDADAHNKGYDFTGYFKECDFQKMKWSTLVKFFLVVYTVYSWIVGLSIGLISCCISRGTLILLIRDYASMCMSVQKLRIRQKNLYLESMCIWNRYSHIINREVRNYANECRDVQ